MHSPLSLTPDLYFILQSYLYKPLRNGNLLYLNLGFEYIDVLISLTPVINVT